MNSKLPERLKALQPREQYHNHHMENGKCVFCEQSKDVKTLTIEEMPKFCHCTRYDKCIIHGGAGTKNISEEANKNQGG